MQTYTVYSLLTLGFGLGLLHALDADHVMAVSALSSKRRKPLGARGVMRFCGRWALGHGGVLVALLSVLIFAGLSLPPMVTLLAEKAVGVMLVAIGLFIFWTAMSRPLRLAIHSHNDVTHMHIAQDDSAEHDHTPILVGMTHGMAGSAPVLAIVPAMNASSGLTNVWIAFGYIFLFSLGVLLAMLAFGLLLAKIQNWLIHTGQRVFTLSRYLIATISIICGSYWIVATH